MKFLLYLSAFIVIITISGCIKKFLPESEIDPKLYVVEGLITDQPGRQNVKVSRSIPLGTESELDPVSGCNVWITDDLGTKFVLAELSRGIYSTSSDFRGIVGRKYTLYIEVTRYDVPSRKKVVVFTLQSTSVEMLPVPPIDSLYYEKVELKEENGFPVTGEGCQVLLNTTDPDNKCRFFRWDYSETWKIGAPHYNRTINNICWVTNKSDEINTKSVTGLSENRIEALKVKFISNQSDRLSTRYMIQVNQYSLDENEFNYWSDLEKITQKSGNFYDVIPSSITGNLQCLGDPDRQVLGYFSVSAKKSKTIYIDDYFKGLPNLYIDCLKDSLLPILGEPFPPPGLFDYAGEYYWIVEVDPNLRPRFIILTDNKECVDCTVRGTNVKPDFWKESWEMLKSENQAK
jgi:hypothetical protein